MEMTATEFAMLTADLHVSDVATVANMMRKWCLVAFVQTFSCLFNIYVMTPKL